MPHVVARCGLIPRELFLLNLRITSTRSDPGLRFTITQALSYSFHSAARVTLVSMPVQGALHLPRAFVKHGVHHEVLGHFQMGRLLPVLACTCNRSRNTIAERLWQLATFISLSRRCATVQMAHQGGVVQRGILYPWCWSSTSLNHHDLLKPLLKQLFRE